MQSPGPPGKALREPRDLLPTRGAPGMSPSHVSYFWGSVSVGSDRPDLPTTAAGIRPRPKTVCAVIRWEVADPVGEQPPG